MRYEIKKIRKFSQGWLVYIASIRESCGCAGKPVLLQFMQEKEPTENEINERIKNL